MKIETCCCVVFAAILFAGAPPATAAPPTLGALPDITIGDMEDNVPGDSNLFVYPNTFEFSTHVSDADSTKGQMLWSFGEYYDAGAPYSDNTQQFQINFKQPIAVGSTAVSNEIANPSLSKTAGPGGANMLNASSNFATFRDIVFSPPADNAPFATGIGTLTQAQKDYSANTGKNVVFYVADDTQNVTYDVIKVKTKDQAYDSVPMWFPTVFDQGGPGSPAMPGWTSSGLNSTSGDPTKQPGGGPATDDVDLTDNTGIYQSNVQPTTTQTDLGVIVRSSSHRYRILGWTNLTGVAYAGPNNYVRGKFYIYTDNTATDPVNMYPPFRVRLQHGSAVIGCLNMSYAATGNSGGGTADGSLDLAILDDPTIESYGTYLKPSRNPLKPSLYRLDLDPIDVPAAGSRPIIPTFESFAFQDQTSASIFLTQCTVGTYPALDDASGTQIMSYSRATTAVSQGLIFASGGFLTENNFTPGYRQHLFNTGAGQATGHETASTFGLVCDTGTANVNAANRFVVGTYDVIMRSNALRPRIQSGKLYRGRYYVTSDVPTTAAASGTERQATVRVRLQTGGGVLSAYQELPGNNQTVFNTSSGPDDIFYKDNVLSGQAIPGINSLNPEFDATLTPAGYDGGWYTVLSDSPLDVDVRQDAGGTLAAFGTTTGTIGGDPGPGSALASPGRDIKTGFDCYTSPRNMVLGGITFTNFFDANRAMASVTAIKLFEYNQIDDGAYEY